MRVEVRFSFGSVIKKKTVVFLQMEKNKTERKKREEERATIESIAHRFQSAPVVRIK